MGRIAAQMAGMRKELDELGGHLEDGLKGLKPLTAAVTFIVSSVAKQIADTGRIEIAIGPKAGSVFKVKIPLNGEPIELVGIRDVTDTMKDFLPTRKEAAAMFEKYLPKAEQVKELKRDVEDDVFRYFVTRIGPGIIGLLPVGEPQGVTSADPPGGYGV